MPTPYQPKSFVQSPYRDPVERLFKRKDTKKQDSDPMRQFPMVKFDDGSQFKE